MTHRTFIGVCLLATFAAGCGGEPTAKVTGTATRGGKPVANVMVVFSPEKGLRSVGRTDENGRFKLLFTTGEEGAAIGKHQVWVELPTGSKDDPAAQQQLVAMQKDPGVQQMLRKYGKSGSSPLNIEVKADQAIDLPLD